jgi:hypothetical protein
MNNSHAGEVALSNTFNKAYSWLKKFGPQDLQTRAGTDFTAAAQINKKGPRKGNKAVTFSSTNNRVQYAYHCCWGHYYNCYGTLVGMYCRSLDWEIEEYNPSY